MSLPERARALARDPYVASLACGILWGSAAGLLSALQEWRAQEYLPAGLPGAALEALARHLAAWVPPMAVVALVAAVAAGLLLGVLRRRHPAGPGWRVAAGSAAPPLAALVWLVNHRVSELPDATSLPGLVLNGMVMAALVAAAAAILRRSEARLPHLSPRRWAAAPALLALASCAGLVAWDAWRPAEAARPLNVVLVTVDTLRADHMGAYGYHRDTSPAFDRFAASGTLFESAATQWPATAPSFASLLTSRYAHEHGVTTNVSQRVRPEAVTLAEVLRDRGYTTAAFVTNANLSAKAHYDQGFDLYRELWRADRDPAAERPLAAARRWLREQPGDRPFFLWVHFLDPHAPYRPGGPFEADWASGGPGPQPVPGTRHGPDPGVGHIPPYAVLDGPQDRRFYVARYDGEIRKADEAFGTLLADLDARGLARKTLVIFTADHGESLGEHDYWFAHGRLPYDSCLRVPLAIRGPGIPAGRVVSDPVQLVDLAPTVTGALRAAPHPDWRGRDLVPLMQGRPGTSSPYAFSQAGKRGARQHIVRAGTWKLVWATDSEDRRIMTGQPFELYDLASDPGESVNLARARSDVSAELTTVLQHWLEGTGGTPDGGGAAHGEDPGEPMDAETEQNLRALGYIR